MNRHLETEEISSWMIGERTPEMERHLGECARCRSEMERLEHAFWQFRDSGHRWSEHWYAARAIRGPRSLRYWRWLAAAGGLASAALMLVLPVRRPGPTRQEEEPFLQIPYVAPLAPYEQSRVMRMDVPVTALMAAGFEVHAAETGGTLTVDVLVGQDGRAHAIRPINTSIKQGRTDYPFLRWLSLCAPHG